ncbi:heterokaryon incompatibility protein-domain-containing protein [Fusarium solani]|uniref:Heterokaryon incompatibility protein-domain-containing protein n=1 Tax=Fusarium solani TaxID=169388 RepID=A0A9P9GJQ7_FUSSL|nr:heterokaryon incompatibility protein-domain-containing protein [Fusarium solani]KAH7239795.1 heterokaryon incompatibility protein-domain-containing protein [Fusarium solani]
MTTLDYSGLPLQPNEVRLVSLEASAETITQAKWKLTVASLADKSASYYAVSYRWGQPLDEQPFKSMTNDRVSCIRINDGDVMVTKNLSDFLHEVQRDKKLKEEQFWIDAICINQEDPQERSHQVSTMMGKIYRSAKCVIAWLGDADSHTQRAFDHLDHLAKSPTLPPSGTQSASTNHSTSINGDGDGSCWESAVKLFDRTYWNRSWIIQELVLPDNVTVRCGGHEKDWSVLCQASHNISTSDWRGRFNNLAADMVSRNTARNYGIPTVLKATRESIATEHWTDVLLHTLIRSRDFEATNEEDKVDALFGLIEDSVDIGKMPLLRPKYGEDHSSAKTYLKVAVQLLRDCEELLILSCVEGRSFQRVKIGDDPLPSWVPDWSVRKPLGLRITGYKRYCADACFTPSDTDFSREKKLRMWPAVVSEGDLTVTICGLKVDEISFRGESKLDIQKGSPFPQLLNMLLSLPTQYPTTGEDRLEALWRTLITNTTKNRRFPIENPSPLDAGFAKWFAERVHSVAMSEGEDHRQWNELKHKFDQFCRGENAWISLVDDSAEPLSAATAEYSSMFAHGMHLRPFVTEKGYLGLGSQDLQEGDTVWVVPRSRVPLIFRRVRDAGSVSDYHCELVGGAYLHGFMDGRALLTAAAKSGMRLSDRLKTIIIH